MKLLVLLSHFVSMTFVAIILFGAYQETTAIPRAELLEVVILPDKIGKSSCPENQRKNSHGKCRKILRYHIR